MYARFPRQGLFCLFLAMLVGALQPGWSYAAEWIVPVLAAPEQEEEDTEDGDDLPPLSYSDAELAFMGMILMIGHVPAMPVDPVSSSMTASSTSSGSITSTLSGGSGSGGVIDADHPSTTPEPAGWLLGVMGSALCGGGAWLRQWCRRN